MVTAVETAEPEIFESLKISKNCAVAIAVSAMFTILFPISTVERKESYFSDISSVSLAFLLPWEESVLSLALLKVLNAVSVAEN